MSGRESRWKRTKQEAAWILVTETEQHDKLD
jgi:hypothetical protein